MVLSEDEIFQKNEKHCLHCTRNTLLPYEYERTCIACDYNVIIQKRRTYRKLNFINLVLYSRQKVIWFCIDLDKTSDGNDNGKLIELIVYQDIKTKK